jgi:hypothetical protein
MLGNVFCLAFRYSSPLDMATGLPGGHRTYTLYGGIGNSAVSLYHLGSYKS